MTEASIPWREEFAQAFDNHLVAGEEAGLLSAYDLGRKAVAHGLGVLDVATFLHHAVLEACEHAKTADESLRIVQAARDFVLECLSPFEMAYRGVGEANTALRGLNELLEEQIRRISHELHDQAGQLLVSVYLALDDVARGLPPRSRARVQSIRGLLDKIEEQLRHLSHELRPTMLDDLGLGPALDLLAKNMSARNGVAVTVQAPPERFSPRVEVAVYRIVQEALTNAGRHARARNVAIRLERDDRKLSCSIEDDGVGFEPEAVLARGGAHGIGLIGMRERLTPLGGALHIVSSPGQGTRLLVTVPCDATGAITAG